MSLFFQAYPLGIQMANTAEKVSKCGMFTLKRKMCSLALTIILSLTIILMFLVMK